MRKQLTLVKADAKGRVCLRGTKKGGQYLGSRTQMATWNVPSAPNCSAAPVKYTASSVELAPVPARTATRPPAYRTVNSMIRMCSS
jgi:hypothetical protein